ncbi:MAG: hypothetical protein RQ741_11765 [Wenzhouxiangellaceae bacterium]|nr:hypothetical protein [Wenzhouxiangellaceae bacterium]
MSELHALLEQLRAGENPRLSLEQMDPLLAWLTGSYRRDIEENSVHLARPDDDPVLLRMVLYRLDEVLFDNGELDEDAAGLGFDQPTSTRRIRFRRLASAFHPDRFPEMSDWLTDRSQAVHQAYGRFKHDPEGTAPAAPGPGRNARPAYREAPEPQGKRRFRRFAIGLRRRFGRDRYLAHKIIGGLAVLALLPVANLWLAPGPNIDQARQARNAAERTGQGVAANAESTLSAGSGRSAPSANELQPDNGSGALEDGPASTLALDTPAPADPRPQADAAGDGNRARRGDGRDSSQTGIQAGADTDHEVSALLIAARRAMNPASDGVSQADTLPTVDEQLRAMGLKTDTERLYGRMVSQLESPTGEVPATAEHEQDQASAPVSTAASGPVRESSQAQAEPGTTPTVKPARTSEPVVAQLEAEQPGLVEPTPNAEQASSMAAADSNTTAAPGNDRAYAAVAEAQKSGLDPKLDADPAQDPARALVAAESGIAGPATSAAAETLAATASRQVVGELPAVDKRPPDTGPADIETVDMEPAGPARAAPETASPAMARTAPPLPDGELQLGFFAAHPAGRLLSAFHAALESGNLPGLVSLFSDDARLDKLRGSKELAEHFRELFERSPERRVKLYMQRLERDGEQWRAEVDLEIVIRSDQRIEKVRSGRSVLQLSGRDGALKIRRLEH